MLSGRVNSSALTSSVSETEPSASGRTFATGDGWSGLLRPITASSDNGVCYWVNGEALCASSRNIGGRTLPPATSFTSSKSVPDLTGLVAWPCRPRVARNATQARDRAVRLHDTTGSLYFWQQTLCDDGTSPVTDDTQRCAEFQLPLVNLPPSSQTRRGCSSAALRLSLETVSSRHQMRSRRQPRYRVDQRCPQRILTKTIPCFRRSSRLSTPLNRST